MNIAFFTDNFTPQVNGIVVSIQLLSQALTQLGHSVYTFAPRYPNHTDHEPQVFRLPAIHYLNSPPTYLGLPFSFQLFQFLSDFHPDVIHLHTSATVGLTGYLFARFKHLPLVYTYHTTVTDPDFQYLFKVKKSSAFTLSTIQAISTFTCNLADILIAPSSKITNLLQTQGVTKPIVQIPNGIDLKPFQSPSPTTPSWRTQLKIPSPAKVLIYVGRLDPEKHVDFLINLMPALRRSHPNTYLLLVGDGLLRTSLQSQINSLSQSSHIKILGLVPRPKIPSLLRCANLFVTPSTSEAHPLTLIEAAAAGLPIVAARDQAYTDIVLENQNGFLPPRNSQAFLIRIQKILTSPALAKKFGQKSTSISNNFAIEKQAQQLISLYKSFTNQK